MNAIHVGVYPEDVIPPSWLDRVRPLAEFVLSFLKISNWDMSIVFCNDEFIHHLNKMYRKVDAPTDVLSFEQGQTYIDDGMQRVLAGDIIISLDTLQSNAFQFKISMNEELKRLIIHGILHLSGMNHKNNDMSEKMLQLQEEIVRMTDMQIIT